MSMQLAGGIDATISVGRTGWSSHPASGIHEIHLVGTDGAETIDAFRPRLEIFSDATPWTQPARPHPEDPMGFWSSSQGESGIEEKSGWWPLESGATGEFAYFLDCLDEGRPSDVPAEFGTHAVEVILAAYRSAANNQVEPLPAVL